MAITDPDIKLLWGRAAGICSNPHCRDDLTAIIERGPSYQVGEMAHIIARSPIGPRGTSSGGADSYLNLILVCPTCHTHIDKAPSDLLRTWKSEHEAQIRSRGKEVKFSSISELKNAVARLLSENRSLWQTLGPKSETAAQDPTSNLSSLWTLRKLDTLVPNNQRIVNMIEANSELLSPSEYNLFLLFKSHARAFEQNQI